MWVAVPLVLRRSLGFGDPISEADELEDERE